MVLGILGPTASGKTGLSIDIANEINGEIVNCDSIAIYKYFDIGSAKPTKEEQSKAKFHLIDYIEPNIQYNVGDFQKVCHKTIDTLLQNKKTPIVCGGSGLYANAALEGIDNLPATSNEVREKTASIINTGKGVDFLVSIDKEYSKKIDLKNTRRLSRAIELYFMTGKIPSEIFASLKKEKRPPYLTIGLTMDKEILLNRINKRVDLMVKEGLFEEVEHLLTFVDKDATPMKSIGYKECIAFFEGLMTKEETIERIKISTRQFAKRQYTWFNKYSNVQWVDIKDINKIKHILEKNYEQNS